NHLVDLRLVRFGAADQPVGEGTGVSVHGVARPELSVVGRRIVVTVEVELVQELERDLAGLPALAHLSAALSAPRASGCLREPHVAATRPFSRRGEPATPCPAIR